MTDGKYIVRVVMQCFACWCTN